MQAEIGEVNAITNAKISSLISHARSAPHLSALPVRAEHTSTSSSIQLPLSGATMSAAMGPSSRAAKLTSSTLPSWNRRRGGGGGCLTASRWAASAAASRARPQSAPAEVSTTCSRGSKEFGLSMGGQKECKVSDQCECMQ